MSVNQAAQQLLEIVQNQRIRGEEPGTQDPKGLSYSPPAALTCVYDMASDTHTYATTTEARVSVFELYFFCHFFPSLT